MVNNKMKIGSLFSGIGGFELGLEMSGIGETIWQVENNSYCIQILEKRWPNAERYKDVKTVGKHNLKPVDLICGGFPCQDVSTAGKGAGLSAPRSGLWFEFLRIVKECRPQWVVVENVAGGAKKWVDPVRLCLGREGYASVPIPLSAKDCRALHIRKRVFIVAHAHSKHLREQSRGLRWPSRKDTTQLSINGEKRPLAHPGRQQEVGTSKPWKECNPWAVEPNVGRVANGVPNRMDRLRALGNAVVPQCAQVIGEFIKQLHTESVVIGENYENK